MCIYTYIIPPSGHANDYIILLIRYGVGKHVIIINEEETPTLRKNPTLLHLVRGRGCSNLSVGGKPNGHSQLLIIDSVAMQTL